MSTRSIALDPLASTGRAQPARRDRFFLGMCLAMGLIVLSGFTPTLFGRALFNVPAMPVYLYLHGLTITAWFALLATQALLVGLGNLALHRRLGWAALAFFVLMPVAGMGTQLAMPHRLREIGRLEAMAELVQTVFWLNTFATLQFLGFMGAALRLRNRAASHKRLMLLASVAMIGPPAARLSRWPVFGNTTPDFSQPASTGGDVAFALGALVLLVGAIIVNDLRTTRRVHRVTLIGAAVLFGMALLVPLFANSGWGKAIVWAVSGS